MGLKLYVTVLVVGVIAAGLGYTQLLESFPIYLYVAPARYSYDEIPDLTGKVALVTGGNVGLGEASVAGMYARGAHVILGSRSVARGEAAAKEIRAAHPESKGKIEVLELNLANLAAVKAAAHKFLAKKLPLHILMLNAGVMIPPHGLTDDGIETQFGVNHVAHSLLTSELLPVLKKSAPSRIVVVSSSGHMNAPSEGVYLNLTKINDPEIYDPWTWYGQSKLANILFARDLARRVRGDNIFVNALHPGGVNTELQRHWKAGASASVENFISAVAQKTFYTPEQAALTQLYAATSPEIEQQNISGQMFNPIARQVTRFLHSKATDDTFATELRVFTDKLIESKLSGK